MIHLETNAASNAFPMDSGNLIRMGLTKLEYFAGLAMQGLIASKYTHPDFSFFEASRDSVSFAKALLAELAKEKA